MKLKFTGREEDVKLAERCLEIYVGDYTPQQQYAASILLHMIMKENYGKFVELVKEVTGFRLNDRNSSRVIAWKKKVKRAGKCEICGSTKNLVAHHIIPWANSIKGRTDIKNGQCLCCDCHKMVHNDIEWLDYIWGRLHGEQGKT